MPVNDLQRKRSTGVGPIIQTRNEETAKKRILTYRKYD